ncbi:MAG TPA: RNA polymerase sigma-54 factor, partial [Tissierellaceae bacterium]
INSIIKHQKEFFYTDENKINPLTLKEIAEDINMHESTVSRVTSNKYVETSKGLFELKYFFNSKISGIEDLSSLDIKNTILDIIDNENKKKPYSDQAITDMLKNRGIKISRRTIAKYRDELEIPSSTMRKKY